MKFINKQRLLTVSFVIAILFALSAFGFQYFKNTQKVSALPCHEVEHYYYDSTYSTQVGYRFVTCHGVYTTGTVTPYVVSFDGEDCPENCPMN